jgi:predicted anti-sigma-YlaC factor YlaD
MICEEVQTQLPALLDGELTPETAVVIGTHLAGCARCSEARDEISAVLEMTKAWNVEGGDVLAGVQQQIIRDEMHSLLLEMKRLRGEVDSLRTEVAELKSRAARRVAPPGRESSVLRFPYATIRDVTRPVL